MFNYKQANETVEIKNLLIYSKLFDGDLSFLFIKWVYYKVQCNSFEFYTQADLMIDW